MPQLLQRTSSVCPVCLKRLPAGIVKAGEDCFLEKQCPEHGRFSTVIWRGAPDLEAWGEYTPPGDGASPGCPGACGLCSGHLRQTCCALVEVTSRCNLACPVCFASAGSAAAGGGETHGEPSVGHLYDVFRQLVAQDNTFVQLSGGEPTVRDDLPEIVAAAKRAGCVTIQLNSNGIRLGRDAGYAKALKDAGLSFVFMQFDGTEDAIYTKLRGQPLLARKLAAIEACGELNLGVTLVPTVVPGINDHGIGAIVAFGLAHSPVVRGIHFQPVSYFGRYPTPPEDLDRITLPELLAAIETQSGGRIRTGDFAPSRCDHPRCGFHGDFVVLPDGVRPLASARRKPACCDAAAHLKNRNFVARRWTRPEAQPPPGDSRPLPAVADYQDMGTFLHRVRSHGFTITAMAFQDAYTLDLERLRNCSLHVYRDGRMIPFCAHYLTSCDGKQAQTWTHASDERIASIS